MNASLRAWLAVLWLIGIPQRVRGDDLPVPVDAKAWTEQTVDADAPETWPAGDWQPVEASQYREFADAARSPVGPPPRTFPVAARYSCRLEGDSLTGEVQWDVRRTATAGPEFARLSPLGFALEDLVWLNRPARWGTDASGHIVVEDELEESTLTGHWRQQGERSGERLVFDMQLPPVVVSELELNLPIGLVPRCIVGRITGPMDAAAPSDRLWRISLGRRSRFPLFIEPLADAPSVEQAQFREQLTVTALGSTLDVNLDLDVDGPLTESVEIAVAHDFDIALVSLGADAPLAYQVVPQAGWRTLVVRLPPGQVPSGTRLRVRGQQSLALGVPHPLFLPRVENRIVVSHQLTLHVREPLQLRDLTLQGYHLMDQRAASDGVETWFLEADVARPAATVDVAAPPTVIETDVAAWVDFRPTTPEMRVRLQAAGQSGAAYELTGLLPRGWQVISVRPFRGSADTSLAGYFVADVATEKSQRLTISLREALRPGEQVDLEIRALHAPVAERQSIEWPAWRSLDHRDTRATLALAPPRGYSIVSSAATSTGAIPEDRLALLESLDADTSAPEVLIVQDAGHESTRTRPVIRFEPYAREFEATPSATVSRPEPGIADASAESRPEPTQVMIDTRLAPQGGTAHRHEVRYRFPGDCTGPLEFALAGPAVVREVLLNDRSVPIVQSGEQVTCPAGDLAWREVSIVYETPATADRLVDRTEIPFPRWLTTSGGIEWRVESSEHRVCTGQDSPYFRTTEETRAPLLSRLFGPLVRDDWSATAERSRELSPSRAGISRMQGFSLPPTATIEVWNRERARVWGWVCFTSVLLAGLLLRQVRLKLVRTAFPLAIAGLALAAWMVPEPFVPLTGSAFLALLLALAIPRRLISGSRGHAAATNSRSLAAAFRSTIVPRQLILMGGCCGWSATIIAGAQSTTGSRSTTTAEEAVDVLIPGGDDRGSGEVWLSPNILQQFQAWESQRSGVPNWLLYNAEYEFLMGDENQFRAAFDVAVVAGSAPVVVELPVENVSFASTHDAEVDGVATTLIPAPRGEGVLVSIPPARERGDGQPAEVVSEWRTHRITLTGLLLRDSSRDQVDVGVPPVASATARFLWPENRPIDFRCSALGPVMPSPDGQSTLVHLGALPRVVASWGTAAAAASQLATTQIPPPATVLTLHPLRIDGQSVLTLPVAAAGSHSWRIPVPVGGMVRSIQGANDLEWEQRWFAERSELVVRARSPVDRPVTVTIDFTLANQSAADASDLYSIGRVWRSEWWDQEWIGLRAATGDSLTFPEPATASSPTPAGLEDWLAALTGRRLETPAYVFRLSAESSVRVVRQRRATERVSIVDHTLSINRASAQLQTSIAITVAGAATPLHEIQVDPNLEITGCEVEYDGADRLARFSRQGDVLRLFLTRPYGGSQTIRLTGRWPIAPGVEAPLPQLQVLDSRTDATRWSLFNRSGWELALSSAGNNLQAPATAAIEPEAPVAKFFESDADRPDAFRLIPGADAASVRWVTQILPAGSTWEQRSTGLVRPVDAPLSTVMLQIPEPLRENLRIEPREDLVEQSANESGDLETRLRPTNLRSGGCRFVVQSTFPTPSASPADLAVWRVMLPIVTSGRTRERLLVVDPTFPFRPTSAVATLLAPDQTPADLRPIAVGQLVYRLSGDECVWSPFDPSRASVQVPLVESQVWIDPRIGLRGLTRFTVVSEAPADLVVSMPHDAIPAPVILNGRELPVVNASNRMTIRCPGNLAGSSVAFAWQIDDPRSSQLAELQLPNLLDSQTRHVAVVIPADGTTTAGGVDELAVLCETTAGLLDAVKLQTSRSLGIDSPVIQRLRGGAARMETELAASSWPAGLRVQGERLLQEWRDLQSIITFASDPPRAGDSDRWDGEGEQLFVEAPGVRGYVLSRREPLVLLNTDRGAAAWSLALRVGLSALLFAFVIFSRHIWLALGDWLGQRPAIACWLLGAFWLIFLEPRGVGVFAILYGVLLLNRRGDDRRLPDTAVVSPPVPEALPRG
jgi:hypothetical protein